VQGRGSGSTALKNHKCEGVIDLEDVLERPAYEAEKRFPRLLVEHFGEEGEASEKI
jgi:hypothetical protein